MQIARERTRKDIHTLCGESLLIADRPFSDKPACCGAARRTGHSPQVEILQTVFADFMELQRGLWQHADMIKFRTLADDHPDLAHSPLLRGALLTLQYAQKHGSIGLTKTKAFKRVFVHWAVEHFPESVT